MDAHKGDPLTDLPMDAPDAEDRPTLIPAVSSPTEPLPIALVWVTAGLLPLAVGVVVFGVRAIAILASS